MSAPRIVAVDLSATNTGVAILDTDGHRSAYAIRPETVGIYRLREIAESIDAVVSDASELWLEQGFSMASHGSSGGDIAEIRGALRYLTGDFTEVPPACLKMFATGLGHAGKSEMIAAVETWGFDVPKVSKTGRGTKQNDGVADAIALREFAAACLGIGVHGDLAYATKWWAKHTAKAGA